MDHQQAPCLVHRSFCTAIHRAPWLSHREHIKAQQLALLQVTLMLQQRLSPSVLERRANACRMHQHKKGGDTPTVGRSHGSRVRRSTTSQEMPCCSATSAACTPSFVDLLVHWMLLEVVNGAWWSMLPNALCSSLVAGAAAGQQVRMRMQCTSLVRFVAWWCIFFLLTSPRQSVPVLMPDI